MQLYIRTQDKRILQKVDNIYLNSNYGDTEVFTWDSDECQTRLGVYKSKERALEVLDEIEKLLRPQVICNPIVNGLNLPSDRYVVSECAGYSTDIKELSTYVYQMPIE